MCPEVSLTRKRERDRERQKESEENKTEWKCHTLYCHVSTETTEVSVSQPVQQKAVLF